MVENIRLVSYNIRKGAGPLAAPNANCMRELGCQTDEIASALSELNADIVLCQEVANRPANKVKSQTDAIAEPNKLQCSYMANRHNKHGDHGNASFSRYPIVHAANHNISTNPIEKRGILHNIVTLNDNRALHLFNAHLGLNQAQRNKQVARLKQLITKFTNDNDPVIIAGDFNDWNNKIHKQLEGFAGLKSAVHQLKLRQRLTWPTQLPFFSLDRIYARGLELVDVKTHNSDVWRKLSDHLPIQADYRLH